MDDKKTNNPDISNDNVSVHLAYIRRDVDDIKNEIRTLKNGFVTRTDFDEHLKADEDHESRIRFLEKSLWKWMGYSSAIGGVVSLLGGYFLKLFSQ